MTVPHSRWLRQSVIGLAAATSVGLAAPSPGLRYIERDLVWGHICYPALGNLSLRAGTVEIWFRFDGDFGQKLNRYHRFALFEYVSPDGRFLTRIFGRGNDKAAAKPSFIVDFRGADQDGKHVEQFLQAKFPKPIAEFHHIAYAWDLERMAAWISVDGKKQGSMTLNQGLWYAMSTASTRGQIRLGQSGKYSPYSQIVVDDFRISDVARPIHELGANLSHPLRLDPYTLLLDPLDGSFAPDGKRESPATFISRFSGETGGLPSRHAAFVPAVFGNGLRLYSPKQQAPTK